MENANKILICDEGNLVSMYLEDVAVGLGCNVVASTSWIDDVMILAMTLRPDVAILDLLFREPASVVRIARLLAALGIALVFTATGAAAVASELGAPVLLKPCGLGGLREALRMTDCLPHTSGAIAPG